MPDLLPLPGGWFAAIILCLAGIVMCFAGSKLVRFALGLAGFIVLGTLASTIVALFTQSPLWAALAFLIAGLVGGGIGTALLTPGMFLLGLAFGYSVSSPFISWQIVCWLIALVAGIVFAVLRKRILALATAATGALFTLEGLIMLVLAVPSLTDRIAPRLTGSPGAIALVVAWAVLAFLGYRSQLKDMKKKKKKE